MSRPRKTGSYYTVGRQQYMMLLGVYPPDCAKYLRDKKIRQGYTTAIRSIPEGTELYIRQD